MVLYASMCHHLNAGYEPHVFEGVLDAAPHVFVDKQVLAVQTVSDAFITGNYATISTCCEVFPNWDMSTLVCGCSA